MFRHLSILALLLFTLNAHAGYPPQMTLCLGDSITEGGPVLGGTPNWCEQIQSVWHNSMYRFSAVNGGIGGNTSTDALNRWATYRNHGYTRVIILIGTNDLASGASAASIFANIQTITNQALADGLDVVVCTVLPRGNGPAYSPDLQARLEALNTSIMAMTNVTVVDLYSAMGETAPNQHKLKSTYDSGDGLHPNGAGHTAMFVALLTEVTWF